jgi:hypothetical protein
MRWIGAITAALVLGFLPAANGSTAGQCAPAGAAILAADRSAQIYDAHLPNGTFAPNVYGCTLDHKHRLLLAHSRRDSCAGRQLCECRTETERTCGTWVDEPVALAATTVAYLESRIDHGSEDRQVIVRSLRTGRVVHGFRERLREVVQLVVKADGAVAWVEASYGFGASSWAIGALDRNGYRLLVESLLSEPRLLDVRGSTLAWELEGHRATAPLH